MTFIAGNVILKEEVVPKDTSFVHPLTIGENSETITNLINISVRRNFSTVSEVTRKELERNGVVVFLGERRISIVEIPVISQVLSGIRKGIKRGNEERNAFHSKETLSEVVVIAISFSRTVVGNVLNFTKIVDFRDKEVFN